MSEALKTRQHQWVKFKITPVSVLADDLGEPVVIVDPDKEQAAEELTQYGCMACLTPLEAENLVTNCPGEDSDE